MNNKYFEEVDLKINFVELEKRLLAWWYDSGLVDKYLDKNNDSDKYFSFQDGPITANNPMGVHHAWGRTYKDLWQRYKNMQGYKQRFQNGFDCQGLWVEVEVEKELGFKNKKDIEDFGVDKFVDLCRQRVKKYSSIQTEQSKRLGYFADWSNSYFTLSEDNNYMIWHFLKVCHENGWLYKGNDSAPWCPRCETAISQHEMLTEDYKLATHESIYMAFKVFDKDEYLLVWTTTPWTIPANIAVAVDKKIDYSLVEVNNKKYWLADAAIDRVMNGLDFKKLKQVKGSDLVGIKYTGFFDDLDAVKAVSDKHMDKFHIVVATEDKIMPITTEDGTGLVHTAVSAGTEDYQLGKKLGLPMIPVIDDRANYLGGFGFLSGKNAKKDPRLVLDYMESNNYAFKIENYTHRYPACWRCKTELVWKITDEWYISMDKGSPTLRDRMKKVAKSIEWIPGFGLKRELDWLDNMHDWLISKKNRYWGLALPIWECSKCSYFEVVGGKDELKEKAVDGWKDFEGKTPHKPQIDKIKLKCPKCDGIMNRIEPVGNPWLDAGIVPFSTISNDNHASNFERTNTKPLYIENRDNWKKWFPADFITESFPGQFKNWFYSLIAMSTVLEDTTPFKTVLGFASLLAEDGRPMHKSWGNSIEFNEGADTIGADVMRWMYTRQDPSQNLLFGYKLADETRRQFHLKLWNIYNFFVTYANNDSFVPGNSSSSFSGSVLDSWVIARLNETVKSVTICLESFDAYGATAAISSFVDDLSLWYIRRSRSRVGADKVSDLDSNSFYSTTFEVLVELSKILAPITPFLSEAIYKNLTKEESVHLASWPTANDLTEDEIQLIEDMKTARNIVERGHALRKSQNIPVRQPLLTMKVKGEKIKTDGVEEVILAELNVKSLSWNFGNDELDTTITPELKEEADSRELVRKIQEARKNLGVKLNDKIDLRSTWYPKDKKLMDWIIKKTLVNKLTEGEFEVKLADEN